MVLMSSGSQVVAQVTRPTIAPSVTYVSTKEDGTSEEETTTAFQGNAPAEATLKANPSGNEGWSATYEWVITRRSDDAVVLDRYLDNIDETTYTFMESGSYEICCYATFINGNDTVKYDAEYWAEESETLMCEIYTSQLEMPNAFSPNGEDPNRTYKPKTHRSIVEFHATIFNRWGQKLYHWDDVNADGWDGTFNGHQVRDGVYYCLVHAKGADGHVFTIRKDVNILRGYILDSSN